MMHTKLDVLSSLERAVQRLQEPKAPKGAFTRDQFQERTGMSKDVAYRFLNEEVKSGRMKVIGDTYKGRKANFYYYE